MEFMFFLDCKLDECCAVSFTYLNLVVMAVTSFIHISVVIFVAYNVVVTLYSNFVLMFQKFSLFLSVWQLVKLFLQNGTEWNI